MRQGVTYCSGRDTTPSPDLERPHHPQEVLPPITKGPILPTTKSVRVPVLISSLAHSFIDVLSRACAGFNALGSGVRLHGLESHLSHLTSLTLSSSICKMGLITYLSHGVVTKIKRSFYNRAWHTGCAQKWDSL